MGTKPVEKKRKKKGRPSLLDLQKRSLRLEQQQQQQQQQLQKKNPNPSPLSNIPSHRRVTRRNPNPESEGLEVEDDEEEEEGKRREKKLKFVLRLPRNGSDSGCSGSEAEDGPARRKRRIGAVGDADASNKTSGAKGTDRLQGEPPDSGPTTPLPDKKLLLFILDRLQKKDTYGVFSEPVDPEELPDYHEVIEHPMDFGTVRKKLNDGVYVNLEQFEDDIFLISSNAMTYNSPDTIYYRQARAIQELAKKSFENLRQDSDEDEPEPKTVRRGRPPSKNMVKKAVSRPPDHTGSNTTDAMLANARDNGHWSNSAQDLSRRASPFNKPNPSDLHAKVSQGLRRTDISSFIGEHKSERDEENTGSMLKGIPAKHGKKPIVVDDNRRNTYKQSHWATCVNELPALTSFAGEKKQLMPIGVQMEHSYSRSLARFAAKLGPIAWALAARRIERVLPPGMKFGRGWVGESEAPQQSLPPLLSTSPLDSSIQPKLIPCSTKSGGDEHLEKQEPPSKDSNVKEGSHFKSRLSPPVSSVTSIASTNQSDTARGPEPVREPNSESRFNPQRSTSDDSGAGCGMQPKLPPFQFQHNATINGLNASFGFNPSQTAKLVRPINIPEGCGTDGPMTHARALDMVSRGNNIFARQSSDKRSEGERKALVGNQDTENSGSSMPVSTHNSPGPWRSLSSNAKQVSVPPDLNVGFQSPGSPVSGVMADSQQPDLALQL